MTSTSARVARPVPGTDLEVYPLGLGGNVFGFTADEPTSFRLLDAFVDAGGSLIDTADSYAHWAGLPGVSEEIIGRWMRARRARDRVVVATKVGQLPGQDNLRPETIRAAIDGSLRRLQTDHVDLYYAHEDHGEALEPTLEAFDSLVRAGKVRHVAASNYSAVRLGEALDVSAAHGFAAYVALQPHYNLVHRAQYEDELVEVCRRRGLGTFPWWGLASGYLTGKYRLGGPAVDSVRADFVSGWANDDGERVLDALDAVAAEHGAQPATVALAWLGSRPGVVAPLASARTPEQLTTLLAYPELELTDDDLRRLDAASAWSALRPTSA